jgi:hypothetical protein
MKDAAMFSRLLDRIIIAKEKNIHILTFAVIVGMNMKYTLI